MAKVNMYISAFFILSFGILILTIGFKFAHMYNPIAHALAPNADAANADLLDY